MTPEKLIDELDRAVQLPGLANIWVPPIRNRIDMLATGIKSPLGIKVSGNDLAEIERVGAEIERAREGRAGRHLGARRARSPADATSTCASTARPRRATASTSPTCSRWSRRRSAARTSARRSRAGSAFRSTCAIRASCAIRSRSCGRCRSSPSAGAQIPLGAVAAIAIADGPPMLSSENARLVGLGLRRHPRPRPGVGGARRAARGRARRDAPAGRIRSRGRASSSISSARRSGSPSSCRSRWRSSSCCSTSPSGASTRRR